VTNLPLLTRTFEKVVQDFGSLEGCISAAGIVLDKPFIEHEFEETVRVHMVNAIGTFFTAQLATKQFIAQNTPGSIVLVASIAASHAVPTQNLSGYAASKGAVKSLMQELAVELAPLGIRVNSISPGYIYTDMTKNLVKIYPHLVEAFEREPPMKRMGDRRDLKLAVVGLLGEGGGYTTGTDISITGGLHLGHI
jgi:sorbose reductase